MHWMDIIIMHAWTKRKNIHYIMSTSIENLNEHDIASFVYNELVIYVSSSNIFVSYPLKDNDASSNISLYVHKAQNAKE